MNRVGGAGRRPAELFNNVSRRYLTAALIGLATAAATSQAHAGAVTVTPNQTTTYTLSPQASPITFGSGTDIATTDEDGVDGGSGARWKITNLGSIVSTAGRGVFVQSGSSLTNKGSIAGDLIAVDLGSGGSITNVVSANVKNRSMVVRCN